MSKEISLWLLLMSLSVPASAQISNTPTTGSVSGIVTNDRGEPLAHCWVVPISLTPSIHGPLHDVYTDDNGHFTINYLPFGSYTIETRDSKDGYPDSSVGLYSGGVVRRPFKLSADATSTQVNVVRGDRAGLITKINVFDGATGKRITRTDPGSGNKLDSASVAIYRVDNPKVGILSGAASPSLFVPAQIPVIVKVSAQGYSTWYYGGAPDLEHAKPLVMQAGQEISFDVVLQPLPGQ